ncbi:hypothetical protein [Dyella nitratireducens]|uniref:Uncharacterized protein n=1 Tax=Dyella nitratireducens TaxID=1849580 RepID=A0ABQ1FIA2_9GAMM|nr:hypothetical protein [Dyella nitratireducens]GGA16455.1 hypothetical protein GCM10010981_00100 [Dyella nitratireducens]GLQ44930.1 hypothetical protein GCM10007902_47800 [Dyella nitratireducens]
MRKPFKIMLGIIVAFACLGGVLSFTQSKPSADDPASSQAAAKLDAPSDHGNQTNDEIKRQVITWVAGRTNFDTNDIVSYDATVIRKDDTNKKNSYEVDGSFEVKTDKPSNVYESANAIVGANRCAVGDQASCGNQFHHTVYFKTQAVVFEHVDGTNGLDVDGQTSVDKSFDVLAAEAQKRKADQQAETATGYVVVTPIAYSKGQGEPPTNLCNITLRIDNQTNKNLGGVSAGVALVDGQNMQIGGGGSFKIDSLPSSSQKIVEVDYLGCPDKGGVANWKLDGLQGYEGDGLHEVAPAIFSISYPNWSAVVNTLRE